MISQGAVPAQVSSRNSVNNTKLAILITFLSILVKGKNHYCEPHPDTIIELLKKYHGIEIKRRWFFQCMNDIKKSRWMDKQRRWKNLPGLKIQSDTSLWWFTVRGIKLLIRRKIVGARELLKPILKWFKRHDNRRPTANDMTDAVTIQDRARALERVRTLIRDIG